MTTEIKKIVITQEVTEYGTTTSFKVKGLNDFEVIGLLSYYTDTFKVEMMQKAAMQNKISDSKD